VESPSALWTNLYRLTEDKSIYQLETKIDNIPTVIPYKTHLKQYDSFLGGDHDVPRD